MEWLQGVLQAARGAGGGDDTCPGAISKQGLFNTVSRVVAGDYTRTGPVLGPAHHQSNPAYTVTQVTEGPPV